jgi:hypothetical protein
MHRLRNAAIAAVFIAIVAVGWRTAALGRPDRGGAYPLPVDRLKREFNAAADQIRIILLLSPT